MKNVLKHFSNWGIAACMVALVVTGSAVRAESFSGVCGDFNNNGVLTVTDMFNYHEYLLTGGAPPAFPEAADIDDYRLITLRDLQMLSHYLFGLGNIPSCPVSQIDPAPLDPDVRISVVGFAPAQSTSTVLTVSLISRNKEVSSFLLPIQVLLEDNPVLITSIDKGDLTNLWQLTGNYETRIDSENGVGLFAGWTVWADDLEYIPAGAHEVGTISVSYPAASTDRSFTVAWKPLRSIQTISTYPDSSLTPLVVGPFAVDGSKTAMSEDLAMSVPVLGSRQTRRGDLTANGSLNILDVNFLVSYLFAAGHAPYDLSSADVNCSNSTNIMDVNLLVSYLFAAGAPPCAE